MTEAKQYLIVNVSGDPMAVAPTRGAAEEFIKSSLARYLKKRLEDEHSRRYWFDPYDTWEGPEIIEIERATPETPYIPAWFVRVHLSDSIDYGFDIVKYADPKRHLTYIPSSLGEVPPSKRYSNGPIDDIIFSKVSLKDAFETALAYIKDKEGLFGQKTYRFVTK
jgi:hypothetical protein